MNGITSKKSALFIFIIMLCSFIIMPKINAASYDLYTVKSSMGKKDCPVRTGPGTNNAIIKNGNDNVYVYANQSLEYIKTETGTNDGKNANWYAVKFDYAAREYTGYVVDVCIKKTTYTYSDDAAFEESIKEFPDSYKPYLRKLHAIHPNWKFKINNTNLDWENASEQESQKGTSAISYLYPSLIFKDSLNPNGIVVDGTSWYAPAKDAVKYFMDPRNFLQDKNIFMFQSLSYDESEDSSVKDVLKSSFMEGSFTEGDKQKSYSEAFIEAGKQSGVSSVHLASRALQEVGSKVSSAVSGKVSGYEGYYNFYNIGAYSGPDNYLKGLQYAKDNGWDSIQKAITGGAMFIGSGYINAGQDTLYFQKFNVSSARKRTEYTHQYQTNIMAPESESASIYKSYLADGKLERSYTFTIPVYLNMPNSAFKVSTTDTVGGSTIPSDSSSKDDKTQNTTSAEQIVKNAGYSLETGYLTKVNPSTDVSTLRANIENKGGKVGYMNSSWQTKTTGAVATGDIISVDDKTFSIVVYGDVSSDGQTTIKDLLMIQKYLLGSQSLNGAYNVAADVSHDGAVTIKDLLIVQKYLLGTSAISQ